MMIIALFVNFVFLSVMCVGVDHVVVRMIAGGQWKVSRSDMAIILCCGVPIIAYAVRGAVGLIDVSPLAVIGPSYVTLAKTTACAINLKQLWTHIWDGIKQMGKGISGTK